jgi:peptide/nickel transport system substrate-binding protein
VLIVGTGSALLAACTPAAPGTVTPAPNPTTPPVAPPTPAAPTPAPAPTQVVTATSAPTAAPQSSAAAPKKGGVLRLGQVGDIASLDGHLLTPTAYSTLWLIYDRLTVYDLNLQPRPYLAESWELSSDAKQIKLNLHKAVAFHSGREFTSDDVKWNLLRVRDPKAGAGQLANQSNWFTTIDTPDKNTLVLKSELPRPAIFDFYQTFNILDRQTMEGPNAKSAAIGTGPFSLGEWVPGDHMQFLPNKNYWRAGHPYLDELQVKVSRDPTAMVTQLEAAAVDAILTPPLLDLQRLKADSKYQILLHPGNDRTYVIGCNVTAAPCDDKRVRQALNYAVDRKRFVDTTLLGFGEPRSLFWNAASPAREPAKEVPFDLTKAKALFAEAGVPDLELEMITSPTGEMSQFAQMYQADLAKIGVKLTIKGVEGAVFLDLANNRKYTGLYTASVSSPSEPSTPLTYSKALDPSGNNNSGYTSERYKQLVSAASTEPDLARRKQIYSQLNDLFVDESFVFGIATQTLAMVMQPNVKGIEPLVHDAFNLADAWLA